VADVAVVIGNHQGGALLHDCLTSIAAQTHPIAGVVVVDGASTDNSREIAEQHDARFLAAPNLGLGFLYNRGVEGAGAEYVLLLNNDVSLHEECLELLVSELDRDETRFAADPTQVEWAGDAVVHARTTIRRGRLLHEYIPGLHLDSLVSTSRVAPTVCANGAAMLVRRSMFLELGGFDETFFMEWEDLDLCWRAWFRGWASVYVPDARLRHRVGAVTTAAVAPRRAASSHHNLMRFALKCLPPAAAARVVGGELLRLARHPRAIGSGSGMLVRELPAVWGARRRLRPHRPTFDDLLSL
jgi:N-acetylglucosaminyl-diphospho-decaprenol L-rhamnosyltransferase